MNVRTSSSADALTQSAAQFKRDLGDMAGSASFQTTITGDVAALEGNCGI